MTSKLWRFFGRSFELGGDARRVIEWHFAIRGGRFSALAVLIALLLCGVAAWLYRKEITDRPVRRWTLIVLRGLFLFGLIAILLEPRIVFTVEETVRRSLLVLVDSSSSMTIEDPRNDKTDQIRAGIATGVLDPTGGLQQSIPSSAGDALMHPSRASLVKAALANPKLDLLHRLSENQDIRPFAFDARVTEMSGDANSWTTQLRSDGRSTAIGDSLRELLARTRGQPLSGVFLITDGANNAGSSPSTAAELATRAKVPLFIWGVGLPAPSDIIVASMYTQDVAFVDDPVSVTIRVRSAQMAGSSAEVILKQNDTEVARQPIHFDADGEQVVQMEFTPKQAGNFKLTATIPPLPIEAVKDNNEQSTSIRVIDGKIKVLLVDERPRWEFKYLQAMLLRDRRVDLKCVLQEADPGLSSAAGSIYLPHLPTDKAELFKNDVIIIGDMDVRDIVRSQLDALKQYVGELGGGMVFIAGLENNPQSYANTPLADLLPVEPAASSSKASDRVLPMHATLTAAGRTSHMLRLADTEEASEQIWSQLPPIYFDALVGRAKAGAQVLAIDPDGSKAAHGEKMPLIALQQYGVGQVLYVGTDDVWRWRKNVGDKYYTTLWGQIVQRLALPHLLGESKKTHITLDKKQYAVGERVTVYAKLYGNSFDPIASPTVTAGYQLAGTTQGRQSVQLNALREQPGMYFGQFVATAAGSYDFSTDSDPTVREAFDVVEPKLELGDTAMNEPLLRQMAQVSGGGFFKEEDLSKLPDEVTRKSETARTTMDVPLWSSPAFFILLLLLITAEWILRKISDLK